MKELLSRDDCVNEKELLTDSPTPAAVLEVSVIVFPALKKPGNEAGLLENICVERLALLVIVPEPTTDGMSKKLIGMFCDTRTIFKRILSLLYCSTTSL